MRGFLRTRADQARQATMLHGKPVGRPSTALHVMGLALIFIAVGMGICALIELASTNRDSGALALGALISGGAGGLLWWRTREGPTRTRDVFAAVGWTWVTMTLFGAVPYLLAGTFATSGVGFVEQVVNSIFESASGFSTTGSTALIDFERPGRGLMMYRQLSQWYGGMGIVVLAVTVLPYLGVGGLDLITAEAPGPSSDRLAPRVSETARRLWTIYVLFTLGLGALLFVVPGPSLYDSMAHALTTTATGGFSPYPDSIGHYNSVLVELVIIAAMLYGGTNFALHWRASRGDFSAYRRDSEFRTYMSLIAGAATLVIAVLWFSEPLGLGDAVRAGLFSVVSLGTSTGFGNATGVESAGNFVLWAPAAQMVILFLFVVGASTGSTSGGIKVMRMRVLASHVSRSVRRSQQPRAIIAVKHGGVAVPEDVVSRMAGFFLFYVLLICVGVITLTMLGGELETSIGAIFSMLGNMGPALGEAGPTASFSNAFSQPARLVLAAFMLIGRLEIFPMLLMFAAPYRAARDALHR